jgi:hypothetical protein
VRRRVIGLFELAMVLAVAGWAGSLAASVVGARRFSQAELRGLRTLSALRDAELSFRASGALDRDADGAGEFGFLGDVVRSAQGSSLATEIRPVGRDVWESRDSSYAFAVFLPDDGGHGVSESEAARVSPREASQCFVAYAWPASYARTGLRAFCVLADGRLVITENGVKQYTGRRRAPKPFAALLDKDEPLCGSVGNKDKTGDHQPWFPVER